MDCCGVWLFHPRCGCGGLVRRCCSWPACRPRLTLTQRGQEARRPGLHPARPPAHGTYLIASSSPPGVFAHNIPLMEAALPPLPPDLPPRAHPSWDTDPAAARAALVIRAVATVAGNAVGLGFFLAGHPAVGAVTRLQAEYAPASVRLPLDDHGDERGDDAPGKKEGKPKSSKPRRCVPAAPPCRLGRSHLAQCPPAPLRRLPDPRPRPEARGQGGPVKRCGREALARALSTDAHQATRSLCCKGS